MFCSAVELESEATAAAAAVEAVDEVQANVTQLFTSIEEIAAEAPLIVYIKVCNKPQVAHSFYSEVGQQHCAVTNVRGRCLNRELDGMSAR